MIVKLRGEQFKQYRKKAGLSQVELSQGVCTQATISLMEKKNQLPGMAILSQLCSRLGVDLSDVIDDPNQNLADVFDQIDQTILDQNVDKVAQQLNLIRIKQLRTNRDKQRYYYFLGMLLMMQDGNFEDALFNFNLAMNQFASVQTDIYQVLTITAAGLAYLGNHQRDEAMAMAQTATEIVNGQLAGGTARQLISVNVSLARLNRKLDRLTDSLRQAKRALGLCQDHETLFSVDEVYWQMALTQIDRGMVGPAISDLKIAQSLSVVCQHSQLRQKIERQLIKLAP